MNPQYMERALQLASLGEGKVNPNPLVGAVVVKNDKIIGEGYHQKFGEKHAEIFALEQAKDEAQGADLYITLEPCSHYGKTPPCAKKIIEMGIKRCIVATLDPNPLVSGNGIKLLQEAGIEIITGVMEKEALALNRVFFKYITQQKSYLFLKCAITLDGKIATRNGHSKWITNNYSRNQVQKLRNKYMGIMVGINTILYDDPNLTARIENGRNPYRIIIDPHLSIPLKAKVANYNDNKTIIITSKQNKFRPKINLLKEKTNNFIFLEDYQFKLDDILRNTANLGIDGIILEGGSQLISNAFRQNEIDGGEIFIAPKIIGDNNAIPFIQGFNFDKIEQCFKLNNVKFNQYGDNISLEFYNN